MNYLRIKARIFKKKQKDYNHEKFCSATHCHMTISSDLISSMRRQKQIHLI